MKRLTVFLILCLMLFASSAYGWKLTWATGDGVKMYDFDNATMLWHGDMVQFIADGGNGEVDDPMARFGDQPAIVLEWLAESCPPLGEFRGGEFGDDYLVPSVDAPNPNAITDFTGLPDYCGDIPNFCGYVLEGEFSAVYIDSGLTTPLDVYTRIFNSPEGEVAAWDWYGNVGWWDGGDVYHDFFTVVPDGGGFASYIITHDDYTDIQIVIPEPGTILIGAVALLLAFFRRK